MPYLADLDPARGAVLVAATHGRLLPALQTMIDDGLTPYIVYLREPPKFSVLVLGLQGGELIVRNVELGIQPRTVPEWVRLGLVEAWIAVELERSRRRMACAALVLKEFQARPPTFPAPSSRRRSKRTPQER
jgi:hypothetical protein